VKNQNRALGVSPSVSDCRPCPARLAELVCHDRRGQGNDRAEPFRLASAECSAFANGHARQLACSNLQDSRR
jgi:hypothetical protein